MSPDNRKKYTKKELAEVKKASTDFVNDFIATYNSILRTGILEFKQLDTFYQRLGKERSDTLEGFRLKGGSFLNEKNEELESLPNSPYREEKTQKPILYLQHHLQRSTESQQ